MKFFNFFENFPIVNRQKYSIRIFEDSSQKIYARNSNESDLNSQKEFLVEISDIEFGKRIFDLLKTLEKNKTKILLKDGEIWVKKVYVHPEEKSVVAFKIVYNIVRINSESNFSLFVCNIEFARRLNSTWTKFQHIVNVYQQMRELGFVLDIENSSFDDVEVSAKIFGLFKKVPDSSKVSMYSSMIELIFKLFYGENLNKYYSELEKKEFFNFGLEYYDQQVMKVGYDYYKTGSIDEHYEEIQDILMHLDQLGNGEDKLFVMPDTLEKCKAKAKKNKQGYNLHKGYKIYSYNSDFVSQIMEKYGYDVNECVIQKVSDLVYSLDGNVVGCRIDDEEPSSKSDLKLVSTFKPNSQLELIIFMREFRNFIDFWHEKRSIDIYKKAHINIEQEVKYSVDENGNFKFYVDSVDELANLANIEYRKINEQFSEFFLNSYAKYVKNTYSSLSSDEIGNLADIKCLTYPLRRYVLCKIRNNLWNKSNSGVIVNFLKEFCESNDKKYAYPKKYAYNPLETRILFRGEAKRIYDLDLNNKKEKILPDGRVVVILEEPVEPKTFKNKEYRNRERLNRLIGGLCKTINVLDIRELIFDEDAFGNVKVLGYITTPKGRIKVDASWFENLSNRDFIIAWAYYFSFFNNNEKVYISDGCYVDENNVYSIDPLKVEFSTYSEENYLEALLNNVKDRRLYDNVDFSKSRIELLKEAKAMTSYCKRHKAYFKPNEKLCLLCKDSACDISTLKGRYGKVIYEDEYAKHYNLGEYNLKVYKPKAVDMAEVEKAIDSILDDDSNVKAFQDLFIPVKKAVNFGTNKFIGYIYEAVNFNDKDFIDISDTSALPNLARIKCYIRLIEQLKSSKYKFYGNLSYSPYGKVYVSKEHKKQVQIVNVEFATHHNDFSHLEELTKSYLKSCILQDPNLCLELQGDFTDMLDYLEQEASKLTQYCNIHKYYYSDEHFICPLCAKEKEVKEAVKLEDAVSGSAESNWGKQINHGGESAIYRYSRKEVVKALNDEVDLNRKLSIVFRILKKKEIIEEINSERNGYRFITIKKVLLDSRSQKLKYFVMDEAKGFPIINLRKKSFAESQKYERKDLLEILIALGRGIDALHNRLDMFFGDLNGNNILVDPKTKTISFVDIDGCGIDGIVPQFYLEDFVDPDSIEKCAASKEGDYYSYAIQAFYYLTNIHPFNGIGFKDGKVLDLTENMALKQSVLGDHGLGVPDIACDWQWMGKDMINAFLNIFENDSRESMLPYFEKYYNSNYGETKLKRFLKKLKMWNSGTLL